MGGLGGQQFGSLIAGVASKSEAEAMKVYDGREKYNEWEFVYDPRRDSVLLGGMMMSGAVQLGTTQPGQAGVGGQPGSSGQGGGFGQPSGFGSGFGQPGSGFGQPAGGFGQPTRGFGQPGTGFGQPGTLPPGLQPGGFGPLPSYPTPVQPRTPGR